MADNLTYKLDLAGLSVVVTRKKIKHMHIRIKPPTGQVSVSAPHYLSRATVLAALTERLGWIQNQQLRIQSMPAAPQSLVVDGAYQPIWGKPYAVFFTAGPKATKIVLDHNLQTLTLSLGKYTNAQAKERALASAYRIFLSEAVRPLMLHWQAVIGVHANEWRLKQMKTRWGSCNIQARRIWLNVALAKKPPECLEYVVVHELVHLLERYHNARFWGYMDQFLPHWRILKERLNH